MKQLTVANLLKFRSKKAPGKKAFATFLASPRIEKSEESGGNYWIPSLSSVSNAYKFADLSLIDDKIEELKEKIELRMFAKPKVMYQRNIDLLNNYKHLNLKTIRPPGKLGFLKAAPASKIVMLKGIELKATPNHIFSFGKTGDEKIGAVWFVCKLNGYIEEEIGTFVELLHRFLKKQYSTKYRISNENCLAIDIWSLKFVNYAMVEAGKVQSLLIPTINDLNAYI